MKWKCMGVLLLMSFVQLVGATPAHASSSWDTVYNKTDSLKVRSDAYSCSYDLDLTNSWQEVIAASSVGASFSTALSNGTWGVSQNLNEYNSQRTDIVAVYWTEDSSGHVEFVGDGINSGFQVIFQGSGSNAVHVAYIEQKSGSCSEARVYHSFTTSHMTVSTNIDAVNYSYGWWNFFVNATVTYPASYEGAIIPTEPPSAKYVALGDSFSSGEGIPSFEYGTDVGGTNENRCHRSPQAYPRLLQNDSSLDLGPTAFVACSGATANDLINGKYGEAPQVDALSADSEVVTVIVGGNDIKFKEFAEACFWDSCSMVSDVYEESYDILTNQSRSDYLPDNLEEVYEGIASGLTSANTGAKVLVVGYPYVVTYQGLLTNKGITPTNCPYLTGADAAGIESIIDELNGVIQTAVTNFGDSRFEFVDPNYVALPPRPTDNELCSTQSHFNGADAVNPEYSFHPNATGQESYKYLIDDFLS